MLPSSETANELQNIEKSLLELVLETPEKGQLSRQPCAGTSEPLRLEQRQKQLPLRRFRSRGFRHLRDLQLLRHLRVEHHQPLQQVAVEVFMPNKTEPLRVGTRSSWANMQHWQTESGLFFCFLFLSNFFCFLFFEWGPGALGSGKYATLANRGQEGAGINPPLYLNFFFSVSSSTISFFLDFSVSLY